MALRPTLAEGLPLSWITITDALESVIADAFVGLNVDGGRSNAHADLDGNTSACAPHLI